MMNDYNDESLDSERRSILNEPMELDRINSRPEIEIDDDYTAALFRIYKKKYGIEEARRRLGL